MRALEDIGQAIADPRGTFRAVVATIARIARDWSGANDEALDRSRRQLLVRSGTRVLSNLIRHGMEAGVFRPRCPEWAIHGLPHTIVAGLCARWALGIPAGRALRARTAAASALAVLRAPRPAMIIARKASGESSGA